MTTPDRSTEHSPEVLIQHIEHLLSGSEVNAALSDRTLVQNWEIRLRAAMREFPEARPALGRLLGELIRAAKEARADPVSIDFVDIGAGRMAIGHRPRRKTTAGMKTAGTTHVVTLLSVTEGAEAIGADVERAGMSWMWLPMASGDPPTAERTEEFRVRLCEINEALDGGGSIYVHCSAGIHRTGMISHALLRLRGLSRSAALENLQRLRTVTAEGVGEHRIAWGHQFAP